MVIISNPIYESTSERREEATRDSRACRKSYFWKNEALAETNEALAYFLRVAENYGIEKIDEMDESCLGSTDRGIQIYLPEEKKGRLLKRQPNSALWAPHYVGLWHSLPSKDSRWYLEISLVDGDYSKIWFNGSDLESRSYASSLRKESPTSRDYRDHIDFAFEEVFNL